MPVYFDTQHIADELTITVNGYFDTRVSLEMARIYELNQTPKKVTVDFHNTESIDSCGLGLLIGMRKRFDCSKDDFRLINCSNAMTKFLNSVRFDKLFTIYSL